MKKAIPLLILALAANASNPVAAQATCPHRGTLDTAFCDANHDFLPDPPATTINPARLILGIGSTEDMLTARKTYSNLVDYLGSCLKRDVQLHHTVGERNILEGMRTGQVHIGQFGTGAMVFAVNFAGAIPFAGKGSSQTGKRDTYDMVLIVRADSPYRKPQDLKGKKVAHSSPTSNSGNLAPRALLPAQGLSPEKDYTVEFSGKHDKSIMGVALGVYDAAVTATDVLERLIAKGDLKRNQLRIIFESDPFPPDAFSYRHDLNPKLGEDIQKCFLNFSFPDTMRRLLENNDRFYPVDYGTDWQLVRKVLQDSGTVLNNQVYTQFVTPKR